jgi:hypothetical protein
MVILQTGCDMLLVFMHFRWAMRSWDRRAAVYTWDSSHELSLSTMENRGSRLSVWIALWSEMVFGERWGKLSFKTLYPNFYSLPYPLIRFSIYEYSLSSLAQPIPQKSFLFLIFLGLLNNQTTQINLMTFIGFYFLFYIFTTNFNFFIIAA